MGDPAGGQVEAQDIPPLINKKIFHVGCFFPPYWDFFLYVEGLFSLFEGHFSIGGWGGGGFFYVEIYLDLSLLAKISAGVHAFAARVVPNILEHIVI